MSPYEIVDEFTFEVDPYPEWFLDEMDTGALMEVRNMHGITNLLRTLNGFVPVEEGNIISLTESGGMIVTRK